MLIQKANNENVENSSISIISINKNRSEEEIDYLNKYEAFSDKNKIIMSNNINSLSASSNLFLVVQEGKVKSKDLKELIEKLTLVNMKLNGWILISEE